ncbi:MAG: restriction endonuclease subunit S, partial [Anaerolineaceae bacterium]|nr:restriction endonuclease subunit S [Anaerolineaceae bacterium]
SLSREFLLWFFKSEYFISNGKKSFTGTAGQQRIHKDYLATCAFPLPPLAEQKRIVAKIEELLPLIDRYEQAWSRLEDFNKRFPVDMQKSILQMAIQGKLVEQRPEEGTGEELYRRIQSEEIETIKTVPILSDEEIPFDIPESWIFVRVENIAILHNGRAYKQNELLEKGKYPVLRVGNLFTNNKWYYSDLELESTKYCDKGDLLYSWSASFGPYIWNGEKVVYHYHIWKIEFSKFIDKKYLYYLLLADTDRIKQSGHGLAMIHVTKAGTEKRVLPLPPLAEQKRIVARLEELLPLCERLK